MSLRPKRCSSGPPGVLEREFSGLARAAEPGSQREAAGAQAFGESPSPGASEGEPRERPTPRNASPLAQNAEGTFLRSASSS